MVEPWASVSWPGIHDVGLHVTIIRSQNNHSGWLKACNVATIKKQMILYEENERGLYNDLKCITSFRTVRSSVHFHLMFTSKLSGALGACRGQWGKQGAGEGHVAGIALQKAVPHSWMLAWLGLQKAQHSFSALGSTCQFQKNRKHCTCYLPLRFIMRTRTLVCTGFNQQGVLILSPWGLLRRKAKHSKPRFLLYFTGDCSWRLFKEVQCTGLAEWGGRTHVHLLCEVFPVPPAGYPK